MRLKISFSVFVIAISLCAYNSDNSFSNNATKQAPVNNVEPPTVEIKGQVVFEQKCAACHGSDGTAGIGNAANLQTSKSDCLSAPKTIANGKCGIPPFRGQLTKEEISDLSNYVVFYLLK